MYEYNEFITSLKVSISECNSYIYKLNTVKKELPYWQITNTVEYDSFNCDILDELSQICYSINSNRERLCILHMLFFNEFGF